MSSLFPLDPAPLAEETPGQAVHDDFPGDPPDPTPRTVPTIFGDEEELPPTWSEHSPIFHTWAKCTRLQSIRRNRRITGNPGLRQHCLNCISIAATHRRG